MSPMGYRCVFGILLLFTAAGCETIDQRIDPDAPDPVGGVGLVDAQLSLRHPK